MVTNDFSTTLEIEVPVEVVTAVENEQTEKIDGRKNNLGRNPIIPVITTINQAVYNGYKIAAAQTAYVPAVRELCEWAENRGVYNFLHKDLVEFFATFNAPENATEEKVEKATRKIALVSVYVRYFYQWLLDNGYEDKIHRSVLVWMARK